MKTVISMEKNVLVKLSKVVSNVSLEIVGDSELTIYVRIGEVDMGGFILKSRYSKYQGSWEDFDNYFSEIEGDHLIKNVFGMDVDKFWNDLAISILEDKKLMETLETEMESVDACYKEYVLDEDDEVVSKGNGEGDASYRKAILL